jgi:hypothetical protein
MKNERKIRHYILLFFLLSFVLGCGNEASPAESQNEYAPFTSFRDIPGVTGE